MSRTECIINGVLRSYDACSSKSLSDAIKFYGKSFVYIGSNDGDIYINGILNHFNGKHHFFVYTTVKQQRLKKLKKLKKLNKNDNI